MGPAFTSDTRPAAAHAPLPRWLRAGCLLGCLVLAAGCRSNAYRDVYTDKMAAEIRALEDQLYAADYENQVLHQKLQRARAADLADPAEAEDGAQLPAGAGRPPRPSADDQLPTPSRGDRRPTMPADPGDDPLDLDFPEIDPGQPRDETAVPPTGLPGRDDPREVQDRRIELPGADLGMPRVGRDETQLVPPGSDDFSVPPIEPGDVVPPPGAQAPPELPPGQIPMPEALLPVEPPLPTALAINPIYSGGHNFDADAMIDGVYLVVQFVDQHGTALDMGDMDIDAQLIVVLLDPESESEDPRLGRWEFTAAEVAKLRHTSPVDGLHVPLRWDDRKPAGQQVAAFVRLVNGAAKLQGERVLPLGGASAVADWTPRAAERLREAADAF